MSPIEAPTFNRSAELEGKLPGRQDGSEQAPTKTWQSFVNTLRLSFSFQNIASLVKRHKREFFWFAALTLFLTACAPIEKRDHVFLDYPCPEALVSEHYYNGSEFQIEEGVHDDLETVELRYDLVFDQEGEKGPNFVALAGSRLCCVTRDEFAEANKEPIYPVVLPKKLAIFQLPPDAQALKGCLYRPGGDRHPRYCDHPHPQVLKLQQNVERLAEVALGALGIIGSIFVAGASVYLSLKAHLSRG